MGLYRLRNISENKDQNKESSWPP